MLLSHEVQQADSLSIPLFQQAALLVKLCNTVSKLHEKRLLYDTPLSSLISLWNIIASVEVKRFFRKREAHE